MATWVSDGAGARAGGIQDDSEVAMAATDAARLDNAGMRMSVCEALAFMRFSGRTPVSESVRRSSGICAGVAGDDHRLSLEKSVLPLVPDPAAREHVKGNFRSCLGCLDGLMTRKREMAFLKDHLDDSLVLLRKRVLPIVKKKRKLDSIQGAKEYNHCTDLCLISQIQARIKHDSEFRRELLKSCLEKWSERAEDVRSLQESLDKLQGDEASAALADFDYDEEMRHVDDGLLFCAHPRLGREGAIYARDEHGTEH